MDWCIDEHNFFMGTSAFWRSCDEPLGLPDYESDSGSQYWYTADGVIRGSNHWGTGICSCDWFYNGISCSSFNREALCNQRWNYAEAKWTSFVPNADYQLNWTAVDIRKEFGRPDKLEIFLDGWTARAIYFVDHSMMRDGVVTVGTEHFLIYELEAINRVDCIEDYWARKSRYDY